MSLGTLVVFAIFLLLLLLPLGLLLSGNRSVLLATLSVLLGLFMVYLAGYSWFESRSVAFTVAYLGVSLLCFGASAKHFFLLKQSKDS